MYIYGYRFKNERVFAKKHPGPRDHGFSIDTGFCGIVTPF